MAYVDVYVAAVPTDGKQAWLNHAKKLDGIFMEAGALEIVETWGSDVPAGKLTSFPMAVQCKPDETVSVGWIKWSSKEARDQAWEVLMKHPDMQPGASAMPFDGACMIFGGFDIVREIR